MWQERLSDRQLQTVDSIVNAYRNNRLTESKFLDKLISAGLTHLEADDLLEEEIAISKI